jgi:predicted metal-dependent enzyme (double-stranded beta helix superfamily)
MFEIESFTEACIKARKEDDGHKAVKEVVERAISDPAGVLSTIGEPTRAGVFKLYNTEGLTILNLVWGPQMMLMPHNHSMWAVIGIYTGREDNIFWRKIKNDPNGRIEAAGAKALSVGETAPFGKDVIHSVTNPIPRLTAALHVYGGDFFGAHRSEWEPEHLTEQTYDVDKNMGLFEKSNTYLNAV